MSKKKSTLNDLEEFLKLQASSLVTPSSLEEKTKDVPAPKKESIPVQEKETVTTIVEVEKKLTQQDLINTIHQLAQSKIALYDFLLRTIEELPNKSTEDTLLINTVLYLKGGSNWKETVKEYWKNK